MRHEAKFSGIVEYDLVPHRDDGEKGQHTECCAKQKSSIECHTFSRGKTPLHGVITIRPDRGIGEAVATENALGQVIYVVEYFPINADAILFLGTEECDGKRDQT